MSAEVRTDGSLLCRAASVSTNMMSSLTSWSASAPSAFTPESLTRSIASLSKAVIGCTAHGAGIILQRIAKRLYGASVAQGPERRGSRAAHIGGIILQRVAERLHRALIAQGPERRGGRAAHLGGIILQRIAERLHRA